jgi:hypothetical protein
MRLSSYPSFSSMKNIAPSYTPRPENILPLIAQFDVQQDAVIRD